jgi:hypothetical protein
MKDKLNIEDGLLWKAQHIWSSADGFVGKRDAINEIAKTINLVPDEYIRSCYIESIAKQIKEKKQVLEKAVQSLSKIETDYDQDFAEIVQTLPPEVDPNDWMQYGFYSLVDESKPLRTGYYFNEGRGLEQVKRSNFVMKPLFHLYSKDDNKRMVEIDNGFEKKILEMPSKSMISLEQFSGHMYEEGHYLFEGNKAQLLKINRKIGNQFPVAHELKTLGWQPEGFFAFANCIVTETVKPFNELGIAAFEGKNFFSPSCSLIYRDIRSDDDPYENDRLLNMKKSPISFVEWVQLFNKVYGEHAPVGICYVFVSCFRDLVFKLDNNCPHLYVFGEKRSGKSKYMESLSNLFFNPLRSFNLNSGTDFAFANYLSRFRNCFAFMNEFDDKAIKEEWFQALKAAYDGEGRERGKGGSRNRTEVMKVNSAVGLAGQYLSTRDDNSLLSRSIVLAFKPNDQRTKEVTQAYNKLKQLEEQGINSIVSEIMAYRKLVEQRYSHVFHEVFSDMKEYCQKFGHKFEDRLNRNHCALLAMCKIFEKELQLPFSYSTFFKDIMERVIDLTRIMTQSDILSEFWRIVSSMADTGELIRGYHYRIEAVSSLELKTATVNWDNPKKVLYVRLAAVYSAYKQNFRRETGKEAMNQESIKNYFENREYFLGNKDNVRFRGMDKNGKEYSTNPTSAYVFDYDQMERLGVYLDFSPSSADETISPSEFEDKSNPDPFNNQTPFNFYD